MNNYMFVRHEMFNQISKELIERGNKTYFISFELNDFFINHDYSKKIYVPSKVGKELYKISDKDLDELDFLEIKLFPQKKDQIYKRYKRYLFTLSKIIKNLKIESIFIYNGSNWVEQLIIYIAKKNNIKVNYLEEGYFRPYTITMDPLGINYKSSIPRDVNFYRNIKVDYQKYDKFLMKPVNQELKQTNEKNTLSKVIKKLSTKVCGNFKLQPQIYIHNTIRDYCSMYISKYLYMKKKNEKIPVNIKYIFVPFQVYTDTQVLFNSPNIKGMEELVSVVVSEVKKYNKKYAENFYIIFKEHPKDVGRVNYNSVYNKFKNEKVIFLRKADTNYLIDNSELVITINSTVGIEALMRNKKVLTIGNAFYNIEELVIHCKKNSQLSLKIKEALEIKVDRELVKQVLFYLRFLYNIEGTWRKENTTTVKNIIKKLNTL